MSPMDELMAEANGRAIAAFLRASGGQAEIHAKDFGWTPGDCSRAVSRLRKAGRIERAGDCVWRLSE